MSIKGFHHAHATLARQAFTLHPSDYVATFATWRHGLIVGMRGETPMAREIQRYLITQGKACSARN
jgi:hypothetical protein